MLDVLVRNLRSLCFHSPKFENITCKRLIHSGSPTIYQLKPKSELIGSLKRMTLGKKDPKKANKTIILLGETGTGKSTLINGLVNHAIGVTWEDDVWFNIVEEKTTSQSESQTSDVIVYEIFGFEGETLPFSLTIVDTPGYGDTRGTNRDSIISQRLHDWFRSEDGIQEISAVGLVLKASVNRLSDRLRYIFDSVVSLFGKDVETNIVALITHSDGRKPRNVLKALEAAKITCAKDENNQIVHFMFDNCQTDDRTEDAEILQAAESRSMKGLTQFADFLSKINPQKLKVTKAVLRERTRLAACIKNLQERITYIELQQEAIKKSKLALAEHAKEMRENVNFTIDDVKVYKEKKKIDSGYWGLAFYNGATCCLVCEENCHYPGCTMAWYPKGCEVMKNGRCTSCTRKCPVSDHVKEDWIYMTRTKTVKTTLQDMKKKYETNKAGSKTQLSLLESQEKELKELELARDGMLNESFQHLEMLEKIALNVDSLSTLDYLDFLIPRMRESQMLEKVKKLEEMKNKMDDGTKAALNYKRLADVKDAEAALN